MSQNTGPIRRAIIDVDLESYLRMMNIIVMAKIIGLEGSPSGKAEN